MSLLVPDESYLVLLRKKNFRKNKNNLAYHPGPVQPPSGEGSPLSSNYFCLNGIFFTEALIILVLFENYTSGHVSLYIWKRDILSSILLSLKMGGGVVVMADTFVARGPWFET